MFLFVITKGGGVQRYITASSLTTADCGLTAPSSAVGVAFAGIEHHSSTKNSEIHAWDLAGQCYSYYAFGGDAVAGANTCYQGAQCMDCTESIVATIKLIVNN